MTKIKVTYEGREDVWLPEKKSLIAWIKAKKFKSIHNFIGGGMIVVGADHPVKSVIETIENCERLAIFTDHEQNMKHSLAVITKRGLEMFDIGKVYKKDLEIVK